MPDPILGERVAVFVVLAPGRAPTLRDLTEYLDELGAAKFKWPERLELVEALPLGPGGKVLKSELRERL